MANIGDLTARLVLDSKQFNSDIDSAMNKVESVTKESAWTKLGDSLKEFGKIATITGGAIVGLATKAVKTAMSFESAFTGVKKTINFEGTKEEADAFFAGIRQDILDLASVMPMTAEEIAGVYEAAGQLGIHNENLTDFATAMIGLGSATNMGANEASVALAQFANVTGMAQTNFDRLGSSIVELGNNMATDERQITNFATELAPLAKMAGMTEPDILGLSAAMASLGLESAASGTAMQRLTQEIVKAVALGDNLETFASVAGMTAEQFKTAWDEDATGAFVSFLEGLGSMSSSEQLEIFDTLDIKQMREVDMLQRLAGNTELVTKAVEMSNTAWKENTALSEEVAKRNADTASQFQMLKNDINTLAIEAGTALLPVIRELFAEVKPLLEKVTEWVRQNPETVVQIAETGVALLGLGTAIGTISKLVGVISSLNPVIIGLGAIMAGFAVAWQNDWLNCRTAFYESVEIFKQKKEETGSTLEAFAEANRHWTRTVADEAVAGIASIWDAFALKITTCWEEQIKPAFDTLGTNIKQFFTQMDWGATFLVFTQKIKNGITEKIDNVKQAFTGEGGLIGKIKSWINEIDLASIGQNLVNKIKDGILGAIDSIRDNVKSAFLSLIPDFAKDWLGLNGGYTSGGGASVGNPTDVFRAGGGSVARNTPYVVGEEGAEVFIPNRDGYIVPNDELENLFGEKVVVNVGNVYGESYLRDYVIDTMVTAIKREVRIGA